MPDYIARLWRERHEKEILMFFLLIITMVVTAFVSTFKNIKFLKVSKANN